MEAKRSRSIPQSATDKLPIPSKRVRYGMPEVVEVQDEILINRTVARAVTPVLSRNRSSAANIESPTSLRPRRNLFPENGQAVAITPAKVSLASDLDSPVKRKLIFGRLTTEVNVSSEVKKVYGIIRKLTGSLGGNGSHGPIYGELTMGSMQKMVNLMKEHTDFTFESRFIDVGSGIGKPNLHVAQDPGVEFSYGIEVELSRWMLGISCLKAVLDETIEQSKKFGESKIKYRSMFDHGDIRDAKSFDPFTHVYMFSIGFPPSLWLHLADMWNRSSSPYLICYHNPRDVIQSYEFEVELIAQMPTSMHGSKEGHTGYIYRRVPTSNAIQSQACDPLFAKAWKKVKEDIESLKAHVENQIEAHMGHGTSKRFSRRHERS